MVSFDNCDRPFFRAQIFAWAASGAPSVDPNGRNFRVRFVAGEDASYHPSNTFRSTLMENGKIGFKTCFKEVLVPTPYIIALAKQHQDTVEGMPTFYRHVESWLLWEFAGGIGHHSGD